MKSRVRNPDVSEFSSQHLLRWITKVKYM